MTQATSPRVVSIKALLEAGAHFGHQTNRWNPKMRPYIYTARNGIHIIDLQKTVLGLTAAYRFISDVTARGEKVLFVGTKKQAQEAVVEEATRAGQYYVTQRWLGGTLTNFATIKGRLKRLADLEAQRDRGDFARLTKAEACSSTRRLKSSTGSSPVSRPWIGCPAPSSLSIRTKRNLRLKRRSRSVCPWWRWLIPTVIPTRSAMSFHATMTPSVASA